MKTQVIKELLLSIVASTRYYASLSVNIAGLVPVASTIVSRSGAHTNEHPVGFYAIHTVSNTKQIDIYTFKCLIMQSDPPANRCCFWIPPSLSVLGAHTRHMPFSSLGKALAV